MNEQLFDENLCWLLSRAAYTLTTELAAELARVGFPPRTHQVLKAAADGEHTQSELVRAVGLDKTTMVVTIDELERLGLAERVPSSRDRRARVIAVTAEGRRKLKTADRIIHAVHDDVLATLPEPDREPFMRSLQALVRTRLAEPAATPKPVRRRRAAAAT